MSPVAPYPVFHVHLETRSGSLYHYEVLTREWDAVDQALGALQARDDYDGTPVHVGGYSQVGEGYPESDGRFVLLLQAVHAYDGVAGGDGT